MTAREAVTVDYWRKSQAYLKRGDEFSRHALCSLAQSMSYDLDKLACAATRTLIAGVERMQCV